MHSFIYSSVCIYQCTVIVVIVVIIDSIVISIYCKNHLINISTFLLSPPSAISTFLFKLHNNGSSTSSLFCCYTSTTISVARYTVGMSCYVGDTIDTVTSYMQWYTDS